MPVIDLSFQSLFNMLKREYYLQARVQFDPCYKEEDWACRCRTSQLTVTYKEHPHIVSDKK